jgi:hypothetical protein
VILLFAANFSLAGPGAAPSGGAPAPGAVVGGAPAGKAPVATTPAAPSPPAPLADDAPATSEEPPVLPVALQRSLDARAPSPDLRARVEATLAAADPALVALLTPALPTGPLPDATGELDTVDLLDVETWLDGDTLRGVARGVGVVQNGVWLDLDLTGGPEADLRLGYGRGWSRANPLDGGASPPPGPLPTIGADRIEFAFDLSTVGRWDRLWAAVTARIKTTDGRAEDTGPAGLVGTPPDEAVDVLLALAADEISDPDLAVALAVTFGALRPLVADDGVPTVDGDARAWLRYGQSIDTWLASNGADWRLGSLDPLGKLTWAWPAAQAAVYGAVPLVGQVTPLDAARWRFLVPDVTTLTTLRDLAPFDPSRLTTARQVDSWVNATLRYRAHDALMQTLCETGQRTDAECEGWVADRKAGVTLGNLGDTPIQLWEGTSASIQLNVRRREGAFVGDCATATALAITTLQALGIPAIGVGWSGADFGTPTHDVPLWYDGGTFRSPQRGPGPSWDRSTAFVYVTLPALHPVNAWTHAREPGGWTRGGSVAGGWTSYGEITRVLRDGLPGAAVGAWLSAQARGEWPTL